MARYSIQEIISLVSGHAEGSSVQVLIDHLVTDTRKITDPAGSVFFAIHGEKRDGHLFIPEAYQQGVRVFVVGREGLHQQFPDSVFILVQDPLQALQQLAAAHRAAFDIPVIGITGSNGKTIVKEWLNHLLEPSFSIVRSPRSYNSQLGVPLSVWPINASHTLAIFEAGISQAGEMQKLEPMIRPGIGVFTNIGDAHSEGFNSMEEKIREKLQLFVHSRQLIYPADQALLSDEIRKFATSRDIRIMGWGRSADADLQFLSAEPEASHTTIHYRYQGIERQFTIPFTGTIAEENALTCAAVLELLGVTANALPLMKDLPSLSMRLDMRQGINHCTIINDSYSADLDSLKLALDFLRQQRQHRKRTLILSDLLQSGKKEEELYSEIAGLVKSHSLTRFVGVGSKISAHADLFRAIVPQTEFYADTQAFIQSFSQTAFHQESILLKGARTFSFEKISALLETKWHQTVLLVNLSAVAQNLTTYRNMLQKGTKIMVMVKAFAYGSGSFEIANLLQFHKVDYLAVAYADEGVELRRAGIRLPIMVMNPEEATFSALVNEDLQPEIFSFQMLERFNRFLQREGIQEFPVHLKIDTGMHRLGFAPEEIPALLTQWPSRFRVLTVFTHLVGSEDSAEDSYTLIQSQRFKHACAQLEQGLGYRFTRHISNTAAISRHKELQMDMVRLGIGLYGVDTTGTNTLPLKEAAVLTTTVAQVKKIPAGETVGYNRKGLVQQDALIATIRIGYADGYPRQLSLGKGKVLIRGRLFPVIGTVCMDMTMIDVTGASDIKEGDEVVVFGRGLELNQLAAWADTIPYDIMTGISQRVKRVYFED